MDAITEKRAKDFVSGTAGAGLGILTTEFASESVAIAAKQTGWAKFGVKAVVKGLIGAGLAIIAYKVPGLWSIFFITSAWCGWGSIFWNLIDAAYSGGIQGAADDFVQNIKVGGKALGEAGDELARFEVRKVMKEQGDGTTVEPEVFA